MFETLTLYLICEYDSQQIHVNLSTFKHQIIHNQHLYWQMGNKIGNKCISFEIRLLYHIISLSKPAEH